MPFESEDDTESGIVYVWVGSKANPEDVRLIEEIADEMFNSVSRVQISLEKMYKSLGA